jgi:hypothetical protein
MELKFDIQRPIFKFVAHETISGPISDLFTTVTVQSFGSNMKNGAF